MGPEVIHIAGVPVDVGCLGRQRCGWCGALLLDYDRHRIAVPEGQDPTPATWPVGVLVAVMDGASWTVEHIDGDDLPEGACGNIDPEVTK